MRKSFGFHNRHSPFSFNPKTLFAAAAVQGVFYDVSDVTTLFQDSAGTVPVTAVGQSVGRILDKSGNGNHATMSTAASQPIYQQTAGGLAYIAFDGSNDSMATGSINFTGTNSMTIWAGITKSSDASVAILAELSSSTNPGSFYIAAPFGGGSSNYGIASTGTSTVGASVNGFAAPVTNVITMQTQIATPLLSARVNGTQIVSSSASQGTGNFGNYPLYIGRRNNATLPFNGRLYGLIVLGAAASSWQTQVTEQWMAGKTGLQF